MLGKQQVIAGGYRKGLERALEALGEVMLLTEGKRPYYKKGEVPWKLEEVFIKRRTMPFRKAIEMISGIRQVNTPLGKVKVDRSVVKHIEDEKTANEFGWCMRNLLYVLDTLSNPQEIWQGFHGNCVFINLYNRPEYKSDKRERLFVVAVIQCHEQTPVKLRTFYAESRDVGKMDDYRCGSLICKGWKLIEEE